jgi:hypothetical protein
MKRTALPGMLVALVLVALTACSPEATRTRNGGPGADVGNHSRNSPEPSTPPPKPGG